MSFDLKLVATQQLQKRFTFRYWQAIPTANQFSKSGRYRRFRWTNRNTAGRNWKPLRSMLAVDATATDRPWCGGIISRRQRQTLRCRRLFVSSCWTWLGQIKSPLGRLGDYRAKSEDIWSMMNRIDKEFQAD